MTDAIDHNAKPDDEAAAFEYALGVLTATERAAVERRAAGDAAFARLIAYWEMKLSPWAESVAPVTPPPQVWSRIAAALPLAAAEKPRLWENLAFWRGLTFASGALAAACFAALVYLGNAPSRAPLIASIDGGGHRHFVATVDVGRGSIAIVPAAYAADATRVPELWLIPPDGKPRPLGLLSADRAVTIVLPADLAALTSGAAVLAVSLEPQGGSPTGLPTGPVIAQGKLTTL
jgi:anti-sigma-K factor RskA